MQTINERWTTFINTLCSRLGAFDKEAEAAFRQILNEPPPSTEQELEWAIAYNTFNHYGFEFVQTLYTQHKDREALLVLDALEGLNNRLMVLKMGSVMPKEFVKEIKLTRPL